MRICLACFQDRLASLFETAPELRLYDTGNGGASPAGVLSMPLSPLPDKVAAMAAHGVDVLVCGGISRCERDIVLRSGMKVIPWICGETGTVLNALRDGSLDELAMPGCRLGRHRGGRCRGSGPASGKGRRAGQNGFKGENS